MRDGQSRQEDILIEDGKIARIGKISPSDYPAYKTIDASGKYIIPGGIDPHVHLALPTPAGNSSDDFYSGSRAALAGGTTYFMDFVTPHKGQSLIEALHLRQAETKASLTPCGLHVGISEWNVKVADEVIRCIEEENIKSFKAYLAYRESIGISTRELGELMKVLGPAGGLLMVHSEDGEMVSRLQQQFIREGKTRPCYHPLSRPPEAEVRAVGEVLELSAKTGCPVYIVHISTGKAAALVRQAKRSGVKVFAETCPHYLLLDESVYDPKRPDMEVLPFILSPPLRPAENKEGLWEALSDGIFDTIGTDHCPFNLHGQKDKGLHDFTKVPNGAGGIEHRLGLMYTYGVLEGKISIERFVELVSTNASEIFGIEKKGKLEAGYDADIVIWNPETEHTISVKNHMQRCDSEIYESFEVKGKAAVVVLGGEIIVP